MRIAYFINRYPGGPSHSFIRREILELERQGVEIIRFSISEKNNEGLVDKQDLSEASKTLYLLDRSKAKIFWSIFLPLFKSPAKFFKSFLLAISMGRKSYVGVFKHIFYFIEACVLGKWAQEHAINHIHAHFGTNSTTVLVLVKFLYGVTFSFTAHGPEEFDKPEALSLGYKINHALFVIAVSSYGRSQLYRWCDHHDWKKIHIVHCALDAPFLEAVQSPVPDNHRLVCVGRLCEQKGQLLLIEAIHRIKEKGIPVELALAGDGDMRQEIEQMINHYDLSSEVKITGWISASQVLEEIVASRGLVLPSFAEGLPVVLMEACALRRPVVTTYIAGIPELIRDGECGWLVPAGSIEDLCEAIITLLQTPIKTLNQLGDRAHELVCINHDIRIECARLKSLFQESQKN